MLSSFIEMFIAAAGLLSAAVLGLPAAIRTLRLWKHDLSFRGDETANDERFVA